MGLKTVVINGRLTREPTIKNNGTYDITSFTVAVDSNRKQVGEEKNPASFFRVTAFGAKGKAVADYLTKGDEVTVTGDIELESYTGKDGNTYHNLAVTANEIHFGRKRTNDSQPRGEERQAPVNSDFQPQRETEPVW